MNIIDKETLNADEWSHNGTHVATRARFCAFIGLTMALGALCGSIVSIGAYKFLSPPFVHATKPRFLLNRSFCVSSTRYQAIRGKTPTLEVS